MHERVLLLFDYLNSVILVYFVVSNAIYTLLMLVSLYAVTMHSKYAARVSRLELLESPVTPPVALIVPAHNEEAGIVQTVLSLLELEYPEKELIVVDDGSTDRTAERLMDRFGLEPADFIYRPRLPAKPPLGFFYNPAHPQLLLVRKEQGGKPDALNVGINMARSPYFCTVDADSIIEQQALLRLIAPVLESRVPTVVSGGVVRIVNGCTVENGKIVALDLPGSWLERCQVVEYIRTFLFGRPGWNFLHATFIASGAFCLLHRESVIGAGGFGTETVTEDIDVIAALHCSLRAKGEPYRMMFATDPICWTEAPKDLRMLARQRRRWQLGLLQTVVKHNHMIFNRRYGMLGMLSMPFHAYIEAVGCLVEALGTVLIPFSFLVGAMPLSLFLLLLFLAVGYGTLLSTGSVLMEEATIRRYPRVKHMVTLMGYALLENLGYRQMMAFFRAQGVIQYFLGRRRWEAVRKRGMAEVAHA